MSDGVELAATLYLPPPEAGPQPCLLEALPYRKDDLTASYAASYERLRDQHGYAVCRLDLRGTGSSGGDATDEYPVAEQRDLAEVIAWLAGQSWCDGQVGMWGTSYSGFNSLQMAVERPPALKAICAIYATDDRWTDDVHWRGGALRLVDLVDYCHYMTAMNVLPPVPAVWGEDWADEWQRRLEVNEPWVLTWLRESQHGPYWDHGSVRLGGTTFGLRADRLPGAGRGRLGRRLPQQLLPHRRRARGGRGAAPAAGRAMGARRPCDRDARARGSTSTPRWPPGSTGGCGVRVTTRTWTGATSSCGPSTRPEPDLDLHEGYWLRLPSVPPVSVVEVRAPASLETTLRVIPDVGTAAWIDCAGHLPWGLSGDQRLDDARSLTWDVSPPSLPVVGHPVARLRVSASAPAASLSVKLCDVFPDGTSALVSRGSLDLAFRSGVHGPPEPLVPGEEYDVSVVLDACAYAWSPGQTLRVSVAGADWPNTVAPPAPVTLTVISGSVELPTLPGSWPAPSFSPGEAHSSESTEGVGWEIRSDVLAPHHDGRDPPGLVVRHVVRRPCPGVLPRRGLRRPPHAPPDRPRGHDVRAVLARRRRRGALGDGRRHRRPGG